MFRVRTKPKVLPKKPLQSGYSQSRSDFPSLRESLYRSNSVQRQSIGYPIILANTGLHHRSSNAIHNVESPIRNGLYDTKVLSRLNRTVRAVFQKHMDIGISIKSQLNNPKLTFKWLNKLPFQIFQMVKQITISNLSNG